MTPRRTLLGVIALLAMTVACTRPEATPSTNLLAPPDSLSPPTTATTVVRTTTTIDVERASIYPVDPITLEAVAGFDPIAVGDWAWGISSDNGSWLALNVGHDDRDLTELRLIDVEDWEVATTWFPSIDTPLHVTDDGTIYVINGSPPNFHLSRMVPGETSPAVIADLPSQLYWYELHIQGGLALIFGLDSPNSDNRGEALIVTVELATGLVTEVPLPGVEVGTIGELVLPTYGSLTFDASPTIVWDDRRSRVLIVNANRDVITEINQTTGEVSEHRFGSDAPNSKPIADGAFTNGSRTAALGRPNGGVLYVATAVQTFEVVDDYLTATSTAEGIEAIDTETWEVIDRLDAPISEVYLSSAGDRLLASGQTYTDTPDTSGSESSGLYVIDAIALEVVAHHGADQPNRYYGGFSVNPDMRIGYVQTWDQMTKLYVVELENGNIVTTRQDFEIQFFADAGVLMEVRPTP
ncbi:MAG TPA: hypothetical protein VI980_00960 [Acidimicrobiia bacterium]|nr:hypothetical protein [Acidimicrobiia bacterium]